MKDSMEGSKPNYTLREVVNAASEENWDLVDGAIPLLAQEDKTLDWAKKEGLANEDDNLRDLAASIFEKTDQEIDDKIKGRLTAMLLKDDNPYASFRAAFALYNKGDRSERVMSKMHEALGDEDVREIAENYFSGETKESAEN